MENVGIYVNPGNTAFCKALNSDIYIDKADLITYTNSRIGKDRLLYLCQPPAPVWEVYGGGYDLGLL